MIAIPPLSELLTLAEDTAVAAGNQARDLLTQPRKIDSKGFRDLVTDADLAAQKTITEAILNHFPSHGFLPEEEDTDLPTNGPVIWIIDPIDGTTNYSRGQTNFCVSVGAALPVIGDRATSIGYTPVVGAIYDPVREELFSGANGKGAYLQAGNGRKTQLQVSQIKQFNRAMLLCDTPGPQDRREKTVSYLEALMPHVFTMRNLGSTTLALAWLAVGRADLYFNFNVRPWDLAAGKVILEEAGGKMTSIDNKSLHWSTGGMNCLGSNGHLHEPFIATAPPPETAS